MQTNGTNTATNAVPVFTDDFDMGNADPFKNIVFDNYDEVNVRNFESNNITEIKFIGNVKIRFDTNKLSAKTVVVTVRNRKVLDIAAWGDVEFRYAGDLYLCDTMTYNPDTKMGVMKNVRSYMKMSGMTGSSTSSSPLSALGSAGWFYHAKKAYIFSPDKLALEDANFSFTGNDYPQYEFSSSRIWWFRDDVLFTVNNWYRVGQGDFFYLPFFFQWQKATGLKTAFGESKYIGYYLMNTYSFNPGIGNFKTGLDFYEILGNYAFMDFSSSKPVGPFTSLTVNVRIADDQRISWDSVNDRYMQLVDDGTGTGTLTNIRQFSWDYKIAGTMNLAGATVSFNWEDLNDPFFLSKYSSREESFDLTKLLQPQNNLLYGASRGDSLPSGELSRGFSLSYNNFSMTGNFNYTLQVNSNIVCPYLNQRYTYALTTLKFPSMTYNFGSLDLITNLSYSFPVSRNLTYSNTNVTIGLTDAIEPYLAMIRSNQIAAAAAEAAAIALSNKLLQDRISNNRSGGFLSNSAALSNLVSGGNSNFTGNAVTNVNPLPDLLSNSLLSNSAVTNFPPIPTPDDVSNFLPGDPGTDSSSATQTDKSPFLQVQTNGGEVTSVMFSETNAATNLSGMLSNSFSGVLSNSVTNGTNSPSSLSNTNTNSYKVTNNMFTLFSVKSSVNGSMGLSTSEDLNPTNGAATYDQFTHNESGSFSLNTALLNSLFNFNNSVNLINQKQISTADSESNNNLAATYLALNLNSGLSMTPQTFNFGQGTWATGYVPLTASANLVSPLFLQTAYDATSIRTLINTETFGTGFHWLTNSQIAFDLSFTYNIQWRLTNGLSDQYINNITWQKLTMAPSLTIFWFTFSVPSIIIDMLETNCSTNIVVGSITNTLYYTNRMLWTFDDITNRMGVESFPLTITIKHPLMPWLGEISYKYDLFAKSNMTFDTGFNITAPAILNNFLCFYKVSNFSAIGNLHWDFENPRDSFFTMSLNTSVWFTKDWSLSFSTSVKNDQLFLYFLSDPYIAQFQQPGEQGKNLFADLLQSLTIWDYNGLKQTYFKMQGMNFTLTHLLEDWTMLFTMSLSQREDTARQIYYWDPNISFQVSLGGSKDFMPAIPKDFAPTEYQ